MNDRVDGRVLACWKRITVHVGKADGHTPENAPIRIGRPRRPKGLDIDAAVAQLDLIGQGGFFRFVGIDRIARRRSCRIGRIGYASGSIGALDRRQIGLIVLGCAFVIKPIRIPVVGRFRPIAFRNRSASPAIVRYRRIVIERCSARSGIGFSPFAIRRKRRQGNGVHREQQRHYPCQQGSSRTGPHSNLHHRQFFVFSYDGPNAPGGITESKNR